MTNEELQIQLPALEQRIPFDEMYFDTYEDWQMALKDLLEASKSIMIDKLFPFNENVEYVIPPRRYEWQIRCCVELFNLADKTGLNSYSENDISWTKNSDYLSNGLMNQLIPRVGVVTRTNEGE